MYRQVYLLVFCSVGLLLLPAEHSPTTRELYVKPTEDTSCPEPCHTLYEYVQNASQYFVSNTRFSFLAGNHNLNQSLHVSGVTKLALVAIVGTVNITCQDNSSLSFTETANLTLENVNLDSCSALVLTDLLHLNLLGVGLLQTLYENISAVSLNATNILGMSTIAGLRIDNALAWTYLQMKYSDYSVWPLSICNQLKMKDLDLPDLQIGSVTFNFELDQSTYGINLLLDNLTIVTGLRNRYMLIYLGVNKESPNNVTLTNLYFISTGVWQVIEVLVEDSPISNTSLYISNCTWSSLVSIFAIASTQVTIVSTFLNYSFVGQFVVSGHNCRPFVMNNVTFTGGQTDVNFNTLTLDSVANVKLINCKFTNRKNSGVAGLQGAVVHLHSAANVSFTNCEFKYNNVTPITSFKSTFVLSGSNVFSNNIAPQGGAMALYEQSYVTLANGSDTLFVNNTAETVGGAIYINYGLPYCFFLLGSDQHQCDYHTSTDAPVPNVTVRFEGNVAGNGGSAMYGASLDTCQIGNHSCQGWNYVDSLFHINQRNYSVLSAITSEPLRACLCDEDGKPSCVRLFRHRKIFPGQPFHVSAVVVGDRFGTVDGSVYAQLLPLSGPYVAELGNLEHSQRVTHLKCVNLSYTILSNSSADVSLVLTASSAWVQQYPGNFTAANVSWYAHVYKRKGYIGPLLRLFPIYMNITLLPCPLGFTLSDSVPYQCVCDPKLQRSHIPCYLTTQSVQRSGTEWVIASFHNNTSNGAIVSKYCPNNYCKQEAVNISLEHPDTQCAFNHSGTLCGGCQSGLSLALGSVQCRQCSNIYLTLLVPFALAGFALVFFIKLLDLTVAKGTLNGLIFYANIVKANQVSWIPAHHTNILTVFIAWINLDLGIETCFFDGLNAYWKTWLQFVFPLYIWALVILIIVISRYSSYVAKIFGSNSVQVLATLFLLSYPKLLRITISIFQPSILDYPDGTSATVWSYDGNIRYFSAKRVPLLLVALMVLLILWLPYTGTLLFAQCLQRSNYRIATLLMKFKPFFDAYFGPLKDKHRYWVGLLLLVRGALFVVYAATPTSKAGIDLLATAVAMLCLLVYPPVGYVYRKTYLNLLENSFLLNLGVLAVGTFYIQGSGGSQAALAYTSIGIAFALFVVLVCFHALVSLRATRLINGLANHYFHIQVPQQANQDRGDYERIPLNPKANRQGVSELRVTLDEYREPVLRYLDGH